MSGLDILLATYNGAAYLPALLQSLEIQTDRSFRLIIRDDGSSDATPDIVEAWARQTLVDCVVLQDNDAGLGAKMNFARLLAASDRPYFMCCDQDDIWLPEKVALSLKAIEEAERDLGRDTPILAHCDLEVVDEDLHRFESSFWRHQRFSVVAANRGTAGADARKTLLIRNFVTGCALIGNAALRDRANPVPHDCTMHDWWLALVAAYLGEIIAIDQSLIQYRQHGSNSVGAKSWSAAYILKRAFSDGPASIERTRRWLDLAQRQAAELIARHAAELKDVDAAPLAEFAMLKRASFLQRKSFLLRYRLSAQSRFHTLANWFVI